MLRPVRPLRRSVDASRRSSSSDAAGRSVADSLRRASQSSQLASNSYATADAAVVARDTTTSGNPSSTTAAAVATPLPHLSRKAPQRAQPSITSYSPLDKGVSRMAAAGVPITNTRTVASASGTNVNAAGTASSDSAAPPARLGTHRASSSRDGTGLPLHASPLPVAAQRLFTSSEIDQLRADARVEYTLGRRLQERKDLFHEEIQQRHLHLADAMSQVQALRQWERESRETLLRAQSTEGLPLLYLEQRIQARIASDFSRKDTAMREEGRAAWKEHVTKSKEVSAEPQTSDVERRAASHRFRAALTFIVVEERNLRNAREADASVEWEAFLRAEEANKAETARCALARFLNTPEQLAIAAARDRRERQKAKVADRQRRLFQEQQDGFIKNCRHGVGGCSVFEGDAQKKICGRCRVKWDNELGFYVSLDRSVKVHLPPQLVKTGSAKLEKGVNTETTGCRDAQLDGIALPPLDVKAKKR